MRLRCAARSGEVLRVSGSGFVESLSRRGGNLTGFTNNQSPLIGKWTELLKEIAPTVTRAALLFNPPTAPVAYYLNPFKAAAESFGMEGIVAPVEDESKLDSVVATQALPRASPAVLVGDEFFIRTNLDAPDFRLMRASLTRLNDLEFCCRLIGWQIANLSTSRATESAA